MERTEKLLSYVQSPEDETLVTIKAGDALNLIIHALKLEAEKTFEDVKNRETSESATYLLSMH